MKLVLVEYHCKEGKRGAFMESIEAEGIHDFVLSESGNICYDYFFPIKDGNMILLLEKWTDAESVEKHSNTPQFARLQELKAKYVENTKIERFDV